MNKEVIPFPHNPASEWSNALLVEQFDLFSRYLGAVGAGADEGQFMAYEQTKARHWECRRELLKRLKTSCCLCGKAMEAGMCPKCVEDVRNL